MKVFSYTCGAEDEDKATSWIRGMGFAIISVILDVTGNESVTILFYVLDQESETMLRLRYHHDTFRDMSA